MKYIKKLENLIKYGDGISCALELDNILKFKEIPSSNPVFIEFLKKCNYILENKYELVLVLNKCEYSDDEILKYGLKDLVELRNKIKLRRVSWDNNLCEIKEIESVKRKKYLRFDLEKETEKQVFEDHTVVNTAHSISSSNVEAPVSPKSNLDEKFKIIADVVYDKVLYDYDISKILKNFSEIKNPVTEILNDVRFINYIKNTTHKKL